MLDGKSNRTMENKHPLSLLERAKIWEFMTNTFFLFLNLKMELLILERHLAPPCNWKSSKTSFLLKLPLSSQRIGGEEISWSSITSTSTKNQQNQEICFVTWSTNYEPMKKIRIGRGHQTSWFGNITIKYIALSHFWENFHPTRSSHRSRIYTIFGDSRQFVMALEYKCPGNVFPMYVHRWVHPCRTKLKYFTIFFLLILFSFPWHVRLRMSTETRPRRRINFQVQKDKRIKASTVDVYPNMM